MKITSGSTHRQTLAELFLFLAGMIICGAAAWNLHVPGYMDAEYYFMNGQRLASGEGFSEMVIWNYLDNPQDLPHPSHTYWLPFTSLVAALGMFSLQNRQFIFAQVPFVLFSALVPVITYRTGLLLHGDHRKALFAGILAQFSGFYLAYQTTTSTLGLYMLEGGLFFWLLLSINRGRLSQSRRMASFAGLGCITGLMHFTRSEGILWLFAGILFTIWYGIRQKKSVTQENVSLWRTATPTGMVLLGYLLIMGFWFVHNRFIFGNIMPPGGILTLWLQDYNQTFTFPAGSLSFSEWLQSGLGSILSSRLRSTLDNLQTLLAVEGEIILLPLLIMGFTEHRKTVEIKIMLLLWVFTFALMSWVFPFAGMRGGFFHSSAAFQPFIWSLVPAGYTKFIQWGVKKRHWNEQRAFTNFGGILCAVLLVFTASLYYSKVIGSDPRNPAWQAGWNNHTLIEQTVRKTFPDLKAVIIVNDPPGYYLASGGRPAVVLPDGDEQTLKAVAEKFKAQVIAIDRNTVDGLLHLYREPASSNWLEYLYTTGDTRIYRVRGENEAP